MSKHEYSVVNSIKPALIRTTRLHLERLSSYDPRREGGMHVCPNHVLLIEIASCSGIRENSASSTRCEKQVSYDLLIKSKSW